MSPFVEADIGVGDIENPVAVREGTRQDSESPTVNPVKGADNGDQISRRTFSQFTISLIGMVASAHDVWALDYPTRTIRIVVGFPAGTAPDITARLFGRWMSGDTRQQFIVDNRTGSGTNITTDIVAHAAPDGYTLLAIISSNTISATLTRT